MADHYNLFPMKTFAATVADCMDLPLPETYAKGIDWVSALMKQRMGGTADRVVLYHADAVGMHIWQKYTDLFAPVYAHTSLAVPMLSTVESVTPVSHASMYTGLDPEQHGIMTYVRPKLECSTLFDVLLAAGKKVAIVAQLDSTFLHIFEGRNLDYFEAKNAIEVQEKALELIATDEYDVISNAIYATIPLTTQNLFLNLYNIPNLNLENEWWAQGFNSEMSVGKAQELSVGVDVYRRHML